MNSKVLRDGAITAGLVAATATGLAAGCSGAAGASLDESGATASALVSPDIVIRQVYGGAGSSGATIANDFVELFNRGSSAVAVDGWSVQYASATGSSWAKANLAGTIPAGGHYLVGLAAGTGTGTALPTPDATGSMNMSGSSGTVALVTNQTLLSCGGGAACLPNASIRDFVGYGSAVQFEGSGAAPTTSATTAAARAGSGCTDTDNNAADFALATPAPHNSSSAATACGALPDSGTSDTGTTDTGSSGDGTPTRRTCTGNFGSGMSATYGRLDGFLVSIINPGQGASCNGDANHVHLQVLMNNSVYDIAVNVDSNTGTPDVDFLKINHALQGGAWSEGWHTTALLDYANDLGVHSGDFAVTTPSSLTNEVDADLSTVNHISVFTTGYSSQGGHLIHREGSNHDGALVLQPLSASPQYLLFHFAEQTF